MEVRTYRAKTMQEALDLVRRELGPKAAVLHTRECAAGGLLRWLPGLRQIEVTASAEVNVPSRLPPRLRESGLQSAAGLDLSAAPPLEAAGPPAEDHEYRRKFRDELKGQLTELHSMVEDLCRRSRSSTPHDLPDRCSTCSPT